MCDGCRSENFVGKPANLEHLTAGCQYSYKFDVADFRDRSFHFSQKGMNMLHPEHLIAVRQDNFKSEIKDFEEIEVVERLN